jgi:hypothetical protein
MALWKRPGAMSSHVHKATGEALVQTISERIGRDLERTGKLVRDEQSGYLALDSEGEGEDALKDLQGHSIRYRIAVGPHKGRQAFKLQSLPPLTGERQQRPVPVIKSPQSPHPTVYDAPLDLGCGAERCPLQVSMYVS